MWCHERYAGRTHGLWLLRPDQLLLPAGTKTVLNRGQAIHIQHHQIRVPRELLRRHESSPAARTRPLSLPAPATHIRGKGSVQHPVPLEPGAHSWAQQQLRATGHRGLAAVPHPEQGESQILEEKTTNKNVSECTHRAYKGYFRRALLVGSKSQLLA